MTYKEAEQKALETKWKIVNHPVRTNCWWSMIFCDPPIYYKDWIYNEESKEYSIVGSESMTNEMANHIVQAHNQTYNGSAIQSVNIKSNLDLDKFIDLIQYNT